MDVPGIPRPMLVGMIAVAVLLFGAGATWATSWLTHSTEVKTQTLPTATTLEIQARVGDIKVVGSDRRDIQLTTKERRSVFARTHVRIEYASGKLTLRETCKGVPALRAGECTARYVLLVPRDIAIQLVTHAGDVRAEDLRGDAELQTTAGDVHAVDVDGRLRLRTISGDIDAESASTDIDAHTTSGDVSVLARNATEVRAQTTSGDVDVRVPNRSYDVEAQATSGDEHVTVTRDESAPRHVFAQTTAGDVRVAPGAYPAGR